MRIIPKLTVTSFMISALCFSVSANAQEWTIEKDKSTLSFIASQTGSEVPGTFGNFDGHISFDPAAPEKAVVEIEIDIASINTGDGQRDDTIKSSDLFDSATFPKAAFKASNFQTQQGSSYQVDASLTMRDVTRKVSLPVSIEISGNSAKAQGELTVQRLDYGIGQGMFATDAMVANPVTIKFDIQAQKNNMMCM